MWATPSEKSAFEGAQNVPIYIIQRMREVLFFALHWCIL